MKSYDNRQILMWLLSIDGINSKVACELLDYYETPQNLYNNVNELGRFHFIGKELHSHIKKHANENYLCSLAEKIELLKLKFVVSNDRDYPDLLKKIDDPPLGFYMAGEMPDCNNPSISIIGSRRCTDYGLSAASRISRELSECGINIISGMARGIDSMAHKAAVEAGGKTIAVLGCGLDICYPPENRYLMDSIKENGCVISEYPLGEKPNRQNFPRRNRIISGISDGVAVIEAEERSGTSITVTQALSQGRAVYAVPGSIFSRQSEGTNKLIKEGAIPVTSGLDIIYDLMWNKKYRDFFSHAQTDESKKRFDKDTTSLATDEKVVYAYTSFQPVTAEEVSENTGFSASQTNYLLTNLELMEFLIKLPGQRYKRRD